MPEIYTTLRDVAIRKYKCLVTNSDNYCHLFLRQKKKKKRQRAAVNVNRVLIVEHVRVGTGSVLAL